MGLLCRKVAQNCSFTAALQIIGRKEISQLKIITGSVTIIVILSIFVEEHLDLEDTDMYFQQEIVWLH